MLLLLLLLMMLVVVMVVLLLLLMMVMMRRVRVVRIAPNVDVAAVTDDGRRRFGRGYRTDDAATADQIRITAVLSFVSSAQTEPVMSLYLKKNPKV